MMFAVSYLLVQTDSDVSEINYEGVESFDDPARIQLRIKEDLAAEREAEETLRTQMEQEAKDENAFTTQQKVDETTRQIEEAEQRKQDAIAWEEQERQRIAREKEEELRRAADKKRRELELVRRAQEAAANEQAMIRKQHEDKVRAIQNDCDDGTGRSERRFTHTESWDCQNQWFHDFWSPVRVDQRQQEVDLMMASREAEKNKKLQQLDEKIKMTEAIFDIEMSVMNLKSEVFDGILGGMAKDVRNGGQAIKGIFNDGTDNNRDKTPPKASGGFWEKTGNFLSAPFTLVPKAIDNEFGPNGIISNSVHHAENFVEFVDMVGSMENTSRWQRVRRLFEADSLEERRIREDSVHTHEILFVLGTLLFAIILFRIIIPA